MLFLTKHYLMKSYQIILIRLSKDIKRTSRPETTRPRKVGKSADFCLFQDEQKYGNFFYRAT